jgi:hypothetical protein
MGANDNCNKAFDHLADYRTLMIDVYRFLVHKHPPGFDIPGSATMAARSASFQ